MKETGFDFEQNRANWRCFAELRSFVETLNVTKDCCYIEYGGDEFGRLTVNVSGLDKAEINCIFEILQKYM